jgi:hypothetical protein
MIYLKNQSSSLTRSCYYNKKTETKYSEIREKKLNNNNNYFNKNISGCNNRKNRIAFILIIICISCSNYQYPVQDNFKLFFEEIVKDPDKLSNIKQNYPNFYNDSITTYLTNQPEYLKKIISKIKNEFNMHPGKIKYVYIAMYRYYFLECGRYEKYFDIIDSTYKFYSFVALKGHDVGFEFDFVYKDNEHFYLLDIWVKTNFYDHSSGKYLGD